MNHTAILINGTQIGCVDGVLVEPTINFLGQWKIYSFEPQEESECPICKLKEQGGVAVAH